MLRIVVAALFAFLLTSCSSGNSRAISESDMGDKWPFTVNQGTVKCSQDSVTFRSNGVTYGVNGIAQSKGYTDIKSIWKTDPKYNHQARISIGPIIEMGLKLCG